MKDETNMKEILHSDWQEILHQVESLHHDYTSIQGTNIALFGAGAAGQEALQYLRNKRIGIQCFIDNNPQKQSMEVGGIPVVSVKHSLATSSSFVLITRKTAVNVIRKQLQDLNFQCIPFDAYYVIRMFSVMQVSSLLISVLVSKARIYSGHKFSPLILLRLKV